ncbi:PP2C family protein-serine/threonine phosphatase [Frankia nepalensis]|uniref:Serine/threonine-protein phosphatase n=1 Tax=Frankia nepalensis TaxID=1836974 RepID=A0A937RFR2_9ACTN|nr:PP2C family protein-serine/threonine phosphatase [Frankia nepalensis]MBL7497448.1 serine/threonine-protein phosphatase [Frankia nepalensis]MBL7514699.1 serine/threonine-protein phosphatase [Frankia nepalensis]MBL7629585.1 serine/threonine-protein phosphatase [Frankia nepalensis]
MGRSATKNAHKARGGGLGADAGRLAVKSPETTMKPRGAGSAKSLKTAKAAKAAKEAKTTKTAKAKNVKAAKKATAKAQGTVTAPGAHEPGAPAPSGAATSTVVDAIVAAALGEAVAESLAGSLAESINESFTELMAGGLATALEQALSDTVSTAVAHELPGALAVAVAEARAHRPALAGAPAATAGLAGAPATGTRPERSERPERPEAERPERDGHAVELAAARTVWESLPPRRLPVLPGLDLAARRVAASDPERIGGDWYDVTVLAADRVVLDVGDVAGHGAGAGALMAELCHAARAYALLGLPPSRLTAGLADVLRAGGHQALASTVTAGLDVPTGRLTWCSAGHPPPVLVTADGEVSFLGDVHGPLLGAAARTADGAGAPAPETDDAGTRGEAAAEAAAAGYAQSTITMPVGATVLFYTAGLVDRSGAPLAQRLDALAAAASRSFGRRHAGTPGSDSSRARGGSGTADSGTDTVAPLSAACDALLDELSRDLDGGPDGGGTAGPAAPGQARRRTRHEGDACLLAARLC